MRPGVHKVTRLTERLLAVFKEFGNDAFSNADIHKRINANIEPGTSVVNRHTIAVMTRTYVERGFLIDVPPHRFKCTKPIKTRLPHGMASDAIWAELPALRGDALRSAGIALNAAHRIMSADKTRKNVDLTKHTTGMLSRLYRDGYAARANDVRPYLYYKAPGVTERPVAKR